MAATVTLKVNTPSHLVKRFRALVWAHYKKEGRHTLPWRKTHDVYKVLVSEVMLQQTQVDRVILFYTKFVKKYPTAKKLAASSLAELLTSWQGLGYNRRAKQLKAAAQALAEKKVQTVAELEALPGVGPYTARAVAAFAFNEDVVFVETNIRTAVIHHFFTSNDENASVRVTDQEIEEVLAAALPKGKACEWYSALMDYGASLKRIGVSHNTKSAHHTKQKSFTGSLREARGAILRHLALGAAPATDLVEILGAERRAQVREALRALFAEGLIKQEAGGYALAD